MCDEHTVADDRAFLARNPLTRRQFNQLGAGLALAAMLPSSLAAEEVTGSEVIISTPDGEADGYFVHPASGRHPGVLIWPDILSLRPAFKAMADRLAQSGYSVLVVNPYYRTVNAPVVPEGASFDNPEVRDTVMPLMASLTPEIQMTDAKAFVDFLDHQDSVDTSRKIGTMGYCMGGPIVMRTAATVPQRIGAAASYHGGPMVTGGPNSPHLLIPKMNAEFLVAIAENDDEKAPEVKSTLRQSFDAAGLTADVEVYEGTLHGWCVPDFPVYNQEQAEKAWQNTLDMFERAL